MANVFDVAKYILKRVGAMTTMKWQKLCYYSQAWALAWDEEPLFDEDFQAWANGPVCPELFNRHKGWFKVDENFLDDIADYKFKENEIETLDSVIRDYGDKSPHWLSELTHQEAPWKIARGTTRPGAPCSNVITKASMQEYYSGLLGSDDVEEIRLKN